MFEPHHRRARRRCASTCRPARAVRGAASTELKDLLARAPGRVARCSCTSASARSCACPTSSTSTLPRVVGELRVDARDVPRPVAVRTSFGDSWGTRSAHAVRRWQWSPARASCGGPTRDGAGPPAPNCPGAANAWRSRSRPRTARAQRRGAGRDGRHLRRGPSRYEIGDCCPSRPRPGCSITLARTSGKLNGLLVLARSSASVARPACSSAWPR